MARRADAMLLSLDAILSADLAGRLRAHCLKTGDAPADVIADLVEMHLDEVDIAGEGQGEPVAAARVSS